MWLEVDQKQIVWSWVERKIGSWSEILEIDLELEVFN